MGSDRTRQEDENRGVQPTATDVAAMSSEDVQNLVHELRTQNRELRNAQAELNAERDHYRELYESASVAYLTLDRELVIREANRTTSNMLQIARTSLVGQHLTNFVVLDHQGGFYDHTRTTMDSGVGDSVEIRCRRGDGSRFWALVQSVAAGEKSSWPDGCHVSITERAAETESELLRQQRQYTERLELALEAGEMGMWDFDIQTGEMVWDARLYRLLGYSEDPAVTPGGFFEHIDEEDRLRVEQNFHKSYRSGSDFAEEFRVIRRDGRMCWLVSRGKLKCDANGHAVRMTGANYDITARKKAEEALRKSEARLRTLVDNLPFGFWAMDMNGRYVVQNGISRQMWGDRVGRTAEEINPCPEVLRVWKANTERAFSGEHVDEEVIYHHDDKPRTYRTIVAPVLLGDVMQGILGVHIDITERKQTEEELINTNTLLEKVADSTHVMLACLDPQFNFLWVNAAYAEAGDRRREDYVGKNHFDLYPHEENEAIFRKVVETGESYKAEARSFRHPDQPERDTTYWDWRLQPLLDAEGNVERLLLNVTDVTENERAKHKLHRSQDELEERVKNRTAQLRALAAELANAEDRERQRVSQILHDELQQQLAALRLKINLLVPISERDQDTAGQVRDTLGLVDDAIAQTRTLSHELSPPDLHFQGLFKALQRLADNMLEDHGLEVRLNLEPEAEPQAEAVASTVYRAVNELLFNVAKHAGDNLAWVQMHLEGDNIRICVSDRGAGFHPEDLQTKRDSCTSFGLLSVEQRVLYLGGRMDMEGGPGKGCSVSILLPAEEAGVAQAKSAAQTEKAPDTQTDTEKRYDDVQGTQKVRILLADDHKVMRESLATRLGDEEDDFAVIGQAATGEEAVELAGELNPDVVVMDVRMSGKDGVEATAEIRKKLPHMQVIGLSMHSDQETAAAMQEAGAAAFLSKSESPEELCERIRQCGRTSGH